MTLMSANFYLAFVRCAGTSPTFRNVTIFAGVGSSAFTTFEVTAGASPVVENATIVSELHYPFTPTGVSVTDASITLRNTIIKSTEGPGFVAMAINGTSGPATANLIGSTLPAPPPSTPTTGISLAGNASATVEGSRIDTPIAIQFADGTQSFYSAGSRLGGTLDLAGGTNYKIVNSWDGSFNPVPNH